MKPGILRIGLLIISIVLSMQTIMGQASTRQTPPVVGPTPSPRVVVDQQYIDDATRAFAEVVALRDSLQKFRDTQAKSDIERATADASIAGLNKLVELYAKAGTQYELMVSNLEKMVAFQFTIIQKLQDMLTKPKPFWQKVLDTLTKVVEAALLILVGRGLAKTTLRPILTGPGRARYSYA